MSLERQIQEIVSKRLQNARPSGEKNLKATCPFHEGRDSDRTLSISLETGAWICFHSTCGEHGALPQLLKKLGMTPQQIDRAYESTSKPRVEAAQHLVIKAELAREPIFLPEYILGAWSEPPPELLAKGFSAEILKQFEVGIDKERDRIVFPIRDFMGRLAAINGRARRPEMTPRYKVYDARWVSGELKDVVEHRYLPDNRKHLYGYYTVYPERFFKTEAECPPLILVEGYKACMWLRQLGFPHTVALQGSSLSIGQRRLLQRLSGPFYVLLDHQPGKAYPDKFGRCASLDIAGVLNRTGKSYVCRFPPTFKENAQPDEFKKEDVEEVIKKAKTTTQLVLEQNQ